MFDKRSGWINGEMGNLLEDLCRGGGTGRNRRRGKRLHRRQELNMGGIFKREDVQERMK